MQRVFRRYLQGACRGAYQWSKITTCRSKGSAIRPICCGLVCGSEATSPGVHRRVMLGYAAALEEAMKEGKWPLFRDEALAVPGTYELSAPWKVAAVAAVMVQASGLGLERGDPAVWGEGRAGLPRECAS